MNRRTLPIVALIASLLVFIGALTFAVKSLSSPSPTPSAEARAAATSPALAVSLPTATPTPTTTMEGATPTAETADEPTPTASRAAASPTRAVPTAVAGALLPSPTATVGGAASIPTPTPTKASQPVIPPTATRTPTVPPAPQPSVAPPTRTATPLPAPPTPTRTPPAPPIAGPPPANVGTPVRLRIPSIGVDAAIEPVTTDADGNMDTPKDPWDTAWYAPGPRPGQIGNAAIAGHVDYHNIGEVVFWDLNKLVPGDEVFVDTDDGKTLRFVVTDSTYYEPDNAPLERIFGQTNIPNLNLITCGGTFDPATREYDHRLVVFTTYAGG
jgi:sortase (surface protein transpeptidase)